MRYRSTEIVEGEREALEAEQAPSRIMTLHNSHANLCSEIYRTNYNPSDANRRLEVELSINGLCAGAYLVSAY